MYIGFDIGGTKMRVAFSENGSDFTDPIIEKTPEDFFSGIQQLESMIKSASAGKPIVASAGGIAGVFDDEKRMLIKAPHLPGWEKHPLKERLSEITNGAVHLLNDTANVGLGEAVAGAGKDYEIVSYITVSTGVGGVRIDNNRITPVRVGFEPGHQVLDYTSGKTLEQLVSGSGLEALYGVPAYKIADNHIWDDLAKHLAIGLHNTILHWSPDVVVLGGSMIVGDKGRTIDLGLVSQYLTSTMQAFPALPVIKPAALGDIGGIHGAFAYLRNV